MHTPVQPIRNDFTVSSPATLAYNGTAEYASSVLDGKAGASMLPPIQPGFQRRLVEAKVSKDGCTVKYETIDVETFQAVA